MPVGSFTTDIEPAAADDFRIDTYIATIGLHQGAHDARVLGQLAEAMSGNGTARALSHGFKRYQTA